MKIDEWDVDIAYSGTQKCLSRPPGLAPLTIGPRGREALRNRKTKVANWYLDMTLVEKYWGGERTYHHTAPITMNYALREALRMVVEEGLEARCGAASHQRRAAVGRAGGSGSGAVRATRSSQRDADHLLPGARH